MLPCGVAQDITIFVLFNSARKSENDVHSIPYTVESLSILSSSSFVELALTFVCL